MGSGAEARPASSQLPRDPFPLRSPPNNPPAADTAKLSEVPTPRLGTDGGATTMTMRKLTSGPPAYTAPSLSPSPSPSPSPPGSLLASSPSVPGLVQVTPGTRRSAYDAPPPPTPATLSSSPPALPSSAGGAAEGGVGVGVGVGEVERDGPGGRGRESEDEAFLGRLYRVLQVCVCVCVCVCVQRDPWEWRGRGRHSVD